MSRKTAASKKGVFGECPISFRTYLRAAWRNGDFLFDSSLTPH